MEHQVYYTFYLDENIGIYHSIRQETNDFYIYSYRCNVFHDQEMCPWRTWDDVVIHSEGSINEILKINGIKFKEGKLFPNEKKSHGFPFSIKWIDSQYKMQEYRCYSYLEECNEIESLFNMIFIEAYFHNVEQFSDILNIIYDFRDRSYSSVVMLHNSEETKRIVAQSIPVVEKFLAKATPIGITEENLLKYIKHCLNIKYSYSEY